MKMNTSTFNQTTCFQNATNCFSEDLSFKMFVTVPQTWPVGAADEVTNCVPPEPSRQPPFVLVDQVIVPVMWSILVFIGFLGNGLVVYVMLCYGELKATNRYITNLALTDMAFILVVVLPTMMHYVLDSWIFGEAMCKFHMYMIYVTLQATCLTLTAMTIDRYFAIVHPIESMNKRTPKVALAVSFIIWIVSLILGIPFAYFHGLIKFCNYYGPAVYCRETWPLSWGRAAMTYLVTVTYVIPFCIFVTCYTKMIRHLWKQGSIVGVISQDAPIPAVASGSRPAQQTSQPPRRRKTTKMVAVVVVLFATSWLPIHIFQLWFTYDRQFPKTLFMYNYKIVAHTISYANSVINPFVYSFLGDGFRKAAKKAFSHWRQVPRRPVVATHAVREQDGASAVSTLPLPPSLSNRGSLSSREETISTRAAKINQDFETSDAAAVNRQIRSIVPRPACITSRGEFSGYGTLVALTPVGSRERDATI